MENEYLTASHAEAAFDAILDGQVPEDEVVAFLETLRNRSESVDEIVGAARAMRRRMHTVTLEKSAIDVCGTGGSLGDRFNVSTAAAFALAAMGIPVAKHGNRGSRIPNGSFDFLEALAIPIELDAAAVTDLFRKTDLCFLFARQFHPAVGAVAAARKRVGGRTIFNLVGPLCNPAQVSMQVLGTVSVDVGEKLARAAQQLGTQRTIVVVGHGGRDELVPDGPSTIFEATPERLITYSVDPREWITTSLEELPVGSAEENAAVFRQWLESPPSMPHLSHWIALNCAVALYLVGQEATFRDGYDRAMELIQTPVVRLKVSQYSSAA
jgi:anthranilate phosphoribosyltransferase